MKVVAGACLGSLILLTTACGGGRRWPTGEAGFNRMTEVSITVKNENFYDATVYTCRSSQRQRLGVVTSNQTRTFEFRWVASDLRFLIDFTAAGSAMTPFMYAQPGDELQLVITSNMHRGLRRQRC